MPSNFSFCLPGLQQRCVQPLTSVACSLLVLPYAQGNKRQANGHINILQSYAKTPQDLQLFFSESSAPVEFLKFSEVLAAFPSGSVPRQPFELDSSQWQLQSCIDPESKQPVHLAVLVPVSTAEHSQHKLATSRNNPADSNSDLESLQEDTATAGSTIKAAYSKQRPKSAMAKGQQDRQLQLAFDSSADANDDVEHALQRYGNGASRSYSSPPSAGNSRSNLFSPAEGNGHPELSRHSSQRLRDEEDRKFNRNLVNANRKTESLDRYKAIVSLVEVCKRRLTALLSEPGVTSLDDIVWHLEPAASLMQV